MKALILLAALWVAVGCGSSAEPISDAAQGPKLSQEEAQQYKGIIPGSRKSQMASEK